VQPYRVPDAYDPPELEFYRFRPFLAGGRLFAQVLLYAPSPDYVTGLLPRMCRKDCPTCCHASHMYSELFVLGDGADPLDLPAWLRPWRFTSLRTAAGPWTPTDVLLDAEPLEIGESLVWLSAAAVYTRPTHRLGGLTSPANAAFSTFAFGWPASGQLWLDANASWWNQSTPGAIQPAAHCDQGCQAYVLAELRDAESGAVIPGYEKHKCILRNVDGTRLRLRWAQTHDHDLVPSPSTRPCRGERGRPRRGGGPDSAARGSARQTAALSACRRPLWLRARLTAFKCGIHRI